MIERIENSGEILALIIRGDYDRPGVSFLTPNEFSQQLAFMSHNKGKVIEPHYHNLVQREVFYTQEVLMIKRGKLRVDIFDKENRFVSSETLSAGDVVLLASGGHGFEVLEDIEMIEVKQGPYSGELDKTKFVPIFQI